MNKKTKRKNVRMNKKKADKKNSNLHLEYDNFSTDDNKSYVEKNTTNEINNNNYNNHSYICYLFSN